MHIVAHMIVGGVIFGLCDVSLPSIGLPNFDAKQIMESDWFKLGKETGLIYAIFVIPLVLMSIYSMLLQIFGRICGTMATWVFAAFLYTNPFHRLQSYDLESMAILLKKDDFQLYEILLKSEEMLSGFQSKRPELGTSYQDALNRISQNSLDYFGDFSVFMVVWFSLFQLMPQGAWVARNAPHFWSVALVLSAFVSISWFRVVHTLAAMPRLKVLMASALSRSDPEIAPFLQIPDEARDKLRKRIEDLLRAERAREDRKPSIRRFVAHQLGFLESSNDKADRGRPFPSLYQHGRHFSWRDDTDQLPPRRWLAGYAAYLYYRFHQKLRRAGGSLAALVRYALTGVP